MWFDMFIGFTNWSSLAKKCFVSYLKALQMLPRNKGSGILQGVDTDAFSASLGLAVAPTVPVVAVSANGDVDNSTHKVKNVNRSLDRLKKQIKAAKEEKRLAAKGLTSSSATAKKHEDSDEEEFLVVKKTSAAAAVEDVDIEDDPPMDGDRLGSVEKVKPKKVKPLKIRQDGESTASVRAGAKRIAFDDTGAAIDPLQKIASMTSGAGVDSAALQQEMSEHLQKARRVIDAVRKEDNARERERVREKHLKKKMRMSEEEENDGGDADGKGGAFLMNAEEEGSSGSDSSGSDGSDGESSRNDRNSDDDSDEEEDYEESGESDNDDMAVSKYATSGKRKNIYGSSKVANDVRLQEEMALKLLGKK